MRKRNISPERLIAAIKEYIDGKGSFDTIAEKYGYRTKLFVADLYDTRKMAYQHS